MRASGKPTGTEAVGVAVLLLAAVAALIALPTAGAATQQTSTFRAVADAWVDAGTPGTNYGATTYLRLDASPARRGYLRFTVEGTVGSIQSAQLRLRSLTSSSSGFTVSSTASTWAESTITYQNAPAPGSPVASTGPHGKGVWVQADVTSLVLPGSTLSVVLQQSSSSASRYRSRESGATYAPQLVVTTVSEPADTQAPTAPAALTATATSERSVDLAWGESTDDVGVVGYEVYRDGARIATTGPVTSYADGTVVPGATYTYAVAALDAAGNRSSFSAPATVSLPASDTQPPSAPSNVVAIARSPVVVDLSWQPSTDDVGVAGYVVHRDGARRAEVGSTTTSYEDAASPATTYTYRVTAMDAAGNESMPSDPAEATTPVDTQAPSQPGNLTADGATPGRVELRWEASTDDVAVAGYEIYRDGVTLASAGAVTSYTDASVEPDRRYDYAVEAFDAAGNRSVPSTASVATAPPAAAPVIAAAGDIACRSTTPTATTCHHGATSDLLADADAVLTLGDNQYSSGTLEQFNASYDLTWGRYKAKTYPSVGNHEYQTAGAAGYFDYFGAAAGDRTKGYYSFDLGAWHLIALNANCSQVGGCGVGSPQYEWLKADLAANAAACTLAYWHQPRFTSGSNHTGSTSVSGFWRLLYADGADVVLNGHSHQYERFAPQSPDGVADARGIREFVVGTGGYGPHGFATPAPNSEERMTGTYGVLKLTLYPDRYAWQFVPEVGALYTDAGSADCV